MDLGHNREFRIEVKKEKSVLWVDVVGCYFREGWLIYNENLGWGVKVMNFEKQRTRISLRREVVLTVEKTLRSLVQKIPPIENIRDQIPIREMFHELFRHNWPTNQSTSQLTN